MRLTSSQIEQGILHPEQSVRDASVFYFADEFSDDPEIMPLVIQAIERYGWDDAFGMYSFVENVVQTEETLGWAIEQLRQCRQPDDVDEEQLTLWLLDALKSAHPDLLKAHRGEIRDLEAVDDEVDEAVEDRILLHGLTAEELWAELEEFCEDNKSEDYLTEGDVDSAHRLVEALGRHTGVYDDRMLSLLAEEIEDYTDNPMLWMEPCIVRLAGELRLQRAIPLVIKKLHEETLESDCTRFLVKIGTDEVVDALAADFARAAWRFRVSAAEILGRIHSNRSVERCLALLDSEEELVVKCRLCCSALLNFTDDSIEPARRLILGNDRDPDLTDVRNDLVAVTMLMGIDLPESERWKEDAKHDVEFRKKWYAEHVPPDMDDDEDEDLDDYEDYGDEPLPPLDTAVREEKKIGGNDPCPCGSGRKYKKCCLKKGNGAALFE
jgi:hypothetical protein